MTAACWRAAAASVAGTAHGRADLPCQDANVVRLLTATTGESLLLVVVSDGAGSARHAAMGSRLACDSALAALVGVAQGGGAAAVTYDVVREWLATFQDATAALASGADATSRDYACTALGAVIGEEGGACFQIGDGAIVLSPRAAPDTYAVAMWPQRGEYENVTNFATDATAVETLCFVPIERPVDEVALFSDGIQRLALHYASQSVHAPFFGPMFAPLRAAEAGFSKPLSAALARFLASEQVNRRTDDDKTLILATRRPAESANGA